MPGRVLVVAGSDSGGGAGIQADLKTIAALGGYATTAITALTAQDTRGVHGILPVPAEFVLAQVRHVLDDIGADAVKTGMLGDAETIGAVAALLQSRAEQLPIVVDPVMIAKGGAALADGPSIQALRAVLLPCTTFLTPNLPEAEALLGRAIPDLAAMHGAARDLLRLGPRAVLLKGGHMPGDTVSDVLASGEGQETFSATRLAGRHTHGTGCTLASAVAVGLAQGSSIRDAVRRARAFVRCAIAAAPGYGSGHGPLGHGVTLDPGRIDALLAEG